MTPIREAIKENVANAWRWGWNDCWRAHGVTKKRKEAEYEAQITQWTENIISEITKHTERAVLEGKIEELEILQKRQKKQGWMDDHVYVEDRLTQLRSEKS